MDGKNDPEQYSRIPNIDDLAVLCRNLNAHGVRYVVIGGFAVIHHGYIRSTGDIDLLVDDSPGNVRRIKKALGYLPDGEPEKIDEGDLRLYRVVRVCGEITVGLLGKACDVTYEAAIGHIDFEEVHGVTVPYLQPAVLAETKLGVRPKDVQDRSFLERLVTRGKKDS
jgi:hypothetical protein